MPRRRFPVLFLSAILIAPAVTAADRQGETPTDYELVRATIAEGLRREVRHLPVTSDAMIAVGPDGSRNDNDWIVQHELIRLLIEGNYNVIVADVPLGPVRNSSPTDSVATPVHPTSTPADLATTPSAADASVSATTHETTPAPPTMGDAAVVLVDSTKGPVESPSVIASATPAAQSANPLTSTEVSDAGTLDLPTPPGATHSLLYRILDLKIAYRPRSVLRFFGKSTQRSAIASVSLRLVDQKDKSTVWASWISECRSDTAPTPDVERLEMTSSLKKIRSPQSEKWGELFTAAAMLAGILFVAF